MPSPSHSQAPWIFIYFVFIKIINTLNLLGLQSSRMWHHLVWEIDTNVGRNLLHLQGRSIIYPADLPNYMVTHPQNWIYMGSRMINKTHVSLWSVYWSCCFCGLQISIKPSNTSIAPTHQNNDVTSPNTRCPSRACNNTPISIPIRTFSIITTHNTTQYFRNSSFWNSVWCHVLW